MAPKSAIALGLMSGTSCDGVTAALVRATSSDLEVLSFTTFPYSKSMRERLLEAPNLSGRELSSLNAELGIVFAKAGKDLLRKARVPAKRVRCVGSHGHTVWHEPHGRRRSTLQIGEPAEIARELGVDVVSGFRALDLASGGEGAPLVPFLDEFLFGKGPARVVLNLGGIANLSVVGRGTRPLAFDTGPGNGLMDRAVRQGTRGEKTYDVKGLRASRGTPDEKKLRSMLADPFFRRKPPKSLDASYFGAEFLRRHFGRITWKSLDDDLATLNAFTARSVADQISRFVPRKPRVVELVASGGGSLNATLMANIADALPGVRVSQSDDFDVPAMAKEAACFALLGLRRLQGNRIIFRKPPARAGNRCLWEA